MPLASCICVAGKPPMERLDDIFCALASMDTGCTTPTLLSATINSTGEEITLVFDEPVTSDGSGFSVIIDFSGISLTIPISGDGTTTIVFGLEPDATEGPATLNYNQGSGNATSGDCPLLSIEGFEVTNNTGVFFFRVTSEGDFRVTSGADSRVLT